MVSDVDRAVSALYAIPPTIPPDDRVRVGMAARDGGVTFEDYDGWQSANPRYDPVEVRSMWKSFEDGPVKAGTLYRMAVEHGWRMNGERSAPRAQAAKRTPEPPRKPAPGMSAAEVWERCLPATLGHPYLVAKAADPNTPLEQLRVVSENDPMVIGGVPMRNALVVPAFAPDGTMQSLQLIPPPGHGKKMNLPGSPMGGASFAVGDLKTSHTVYIVEGVGQAWAVWQATGDAAMVCFGWGNVAKVAAALRQKDATARLVICPDAGKEVDAARVAAEFDCIVAAMPKGEASNFDANDLMQRDGVKALAELLQSAKEPPKPEPLLKPVSVFDVTTNPSPPPAFVWDGYLPRGVVSLLGAHGGTGKSTIALMLGVCTALGRPLFGVDTKQCNVVFASFEDGAHIVRHRLAHICRTWAIDPRELEDKLTVIDGTANPELFSADARSAGDTTSAYAELCALVQATNAGLVVVDNASDSFGGDEINRRQVRAFMRALAKVARLTDCAALLLAHVDKGTSRNRKAEGGEGYSGSTAWHNSARSRLFMSRAEDGTLTLEHQKSNLGKMREPLVLWWPDAGLPMLANDAPDVSGFTERMQGRADDAAAAALLRILAEFESRGQYASPMPSARNNVYALLRSEPTFKALKLNSDDTKRIVNQCQRAKWLEPMDYRTPDRKDRQRWFITLDGRAFAGLPDAPTAPTAPTCHESAQSAEGAMGGAPTAPTLQGGTGGERAHIDDVSLVQGVTHD